MYWKRGGGGGLKGGFGWTPPLLLGPPKLDATSRPPGRVSSCV